MLSTGSGYSRSVSRRLGQLGQLQGEGEAEHGLPGSERQLCRASPSEGLPQRDEDDPDEGRSVEPCAAPAPDITATLQRSADPERAVPHRGRGPYRLHAFCIAPAYAGVALLCDKGKGHRGHRRHGSAAASGAFLLGATRANVTNHLDQRPRSGFGWGAETAFQPQQGNRLTRRGRGSR